MKRILNKLKFKSKTKEESPPPYIENEEVPLNNFQRGRELHEIHQSSSCEVLDLLANCKLSTEECEVEYAEIPEMGTWHSTPLPGRHKSKISLTWVLKDLENARTHETICAGNQTKPIEDCSRYQRQNKYENTPRKCKRSASKHRVVGRNEFYNNYKFQVKSGCDLVNDTCSEDTSIATEVCRRRRHKHRRRKSRTVDKFGYDIRDLDDFLSEATIDSPGNIPVVVAYPTPLYQTRGGVQTQLDLPLGTVVNAVFKNKHWLYVQTPHAHEGYIAYTACLPLGILPNTSPAQKKTPCWESSTDIYPRPCGNLTDTEKEQLRGRTRSESRYRTTNKRKTYTKSLCGEEDFDSLYLKTKSFTNVKVQNSRRYKSKDYEMRHTLLVVNQDFVGSSMNNTLSVGKGDVVILIQGNGVESDVDAEWFYVKRRDGRLGFIPAEIAGHGYI